MWTYNDNYLMHYGVKGMKWGIRKQRPTVRKIKNNPHISAGYKSDGTRGYKTSRISKVTEKQAKEKANAYMKKHLGAKWSANPKNKEIYKLVVSEMYMEIESKGRYKSPYL